MKKYKILVVSPYEGLGQIAKILQDERDDVEIHVAEGDLGVGAKIVREMNREDFDVIISRGGTAEQIRRETQIPVVDIKFQPYDMIRMLKMAEKVSAKWAIVGFPSIADCAKSVSEMLKQNTHIRIIHSVEEAENTVLALKKEGYDFIIGDLTVRNATIKYDVNGVLITSGPESVRSSIENAVELCKSVGVIKRALGIHSGILDHSGVLLYGQSESGSVSYDNIPWEITQKEALLAAANQMHAAVAQNGTHSMEVQLPETVWNISGQHFQAGGERVYLYTFNEINSDRQYREIFKVYEPDVRADIFLGGISEGGNPAMAHLMETVSVYAKTLLPVLVSGEAYVGKASVALALHKQSAKREQPFILIHCGDVTPSMFKEEFARELQAAYKAGATLFFDEIENLPLEAQYEVYTFVEKSCQRNGKYRIIASTCTNLKEQVSRGLFLKQLERTLSELELFVPSLRERADDIEGIAQLLIHEINTKYGKEALGFDSSATKILNNYGWPGNFDQLRKVIQALVLQCRGYYIGAEDLSREITEFKPYHAHKIDLTKPLHEITRDVVLHVLEEENNNQSNAAKRLEISRSTIWRIINKD